MGWTHWFAFDWMIRALDLPPARDEGRGLAAVSRLRQEGLEPTFHQLDILCAESIKKFRTHLQAQHGGLDVLINNAGIAFKVCHPTPLSFTPSHQGEGGSWVELPPFTTPGTTHRISIFVSLILPLSHRALHPFVVSKFTVTCMP